MKPEAGAELAAIRLFFASSLYPQSRLGNEKNYLLSRAITRRRRRKKNKEKGRIFLSSAGETPSMPYGEAPWIFTGRYVSSIPRSVGHECGLGERGRSSGSNSFLAIDFAGQTTALLFFFLLLNLDHHLIPTTPPGPCTSSSSSLSPRPRSTSRRISTSSAFLGKQRERETERKEEEKIFHFSLSLPLL